MKHAHAGITSLEMAKLLNLEMLFFPTLSRLSPLDMERNLERARLGPAARLGPQPPGVRLELKIFHRSIIGEIQAKGRKFP